MGEGAGRDLVKGSSVPSQQHKNCVICHREQGMGIPKPSFPAAGRWENTKEWRYLRRNEDLGVGFKQWSYKNVENPSFDLELVAEFFIPKTDLALATDKTEL